MQELPGLKNAPKKKIAEMALKAGMQIGQKQGAQAVVQGVQQKMAAARQAPQGAPAPAPQAMPPQPGMKKGGKVKSFAKGGGIESKGKTRGKFI